MRDWLGWLGVGDQLGLKDIERDHVADGVGQGLRLPEALRDAVGAADRSQSPCLWDALRWEVVTKKDEYLQVYKMEGTWFKMHPCCLGRTPHLT